MKGQLFFAPADYFSSLVLLCLYTNTDGEQHKIFIKALEDGKFPDPQKITVKDIFNILDNRSDYIHSIVHNIPTRFYTKENTVNLVETLKQTVREYDQEVYDSCLEHVMLQRLTLLNDVEFLKAIKA